MKLALVHDYLMQDGGAEKVLETLMSLYPEAPVFTLFHDPDAIPQLKHKRLHTSFLNKPVLRTRYQWLLPLMPTAIESFDLSDYDVIISSSSTFAKGVMTKPGSLHICYCHTPTRFLWSDAHHYVADLPISRFLKPLLPPLLSQLRLWDRQAAERVTFFVANSNTVAGRIAHYYQKPSQVIYPPVSIEKFRISSEPKTYFLAGGRMVPYKRLELIVEVGNQTGIPIKIFGTGPQEALLRKRADKNIEFLGKVSEEVLAILYANAKAFLHPQVEDFGISLIESFASGRPAIANAQGGAGETMRPGVTGISLKDLSWESLADALIRFEERAYDPEAIRAHALQYSGERFRREFKEFVEGALKRNTRVA